MNHVVKAEFTSVWWLYLYHCYMQVVYEFGVLSIHIITTTLMLLSVMILWYKFTTTLDKKKVWILVLCSDLMWTPTCFTCTVIFFLDKDTNSSVTTVRSLKWLVTLWNTLDLANASESFEAGWSVFEEVIPKKHVSFLASVS